jgi:subtilase family serine protease
MKKLTTYLIILCFIVSTAAVSLGDTALKPVLKPMINKELRIQQPGTGKLAELYIERIDAPAQIVAGQILRNLSITVKNSGASQAPGQQLKEKKPTKKNGYTIQITLAGPTPVSLTDITSTYNLQPRQSRTFTLNNRIKIPENLSAGTYYIKATVDPGNRVPEMKEDNNTRSKRLIVKAAPSPDLTTVVNGTPQIIVGNKISNLSIVVNNTGVGRAKGVAAATPGSQVAGYFVRIDLVSLDPSSQSVKLLHMISNTPDLRPGQSTTFDLSNRILIPANTPAGYYQITATVDSAGLVKESNENNNTNAYPFKIDTPIPPDLQTSLGSLNSRMAPGQIAPSCSVTVSNTGVTTAVGGQNGFSIAIVLSSTPTIPTGIPSGTQTFTDPMLLNRIWYPTDLPAGQSKTYYINNNIRIPADTPIGQYYILAVADPENKVAEVSETNNIAAHTVDVQPPDNPDLQVTQLTQVNELTMEVTVVNNGPGNIPLGFYTDTNTNATIQFTLDNQNFSGASLAAFDPLKALEHPGGTLTKTIASGMARNPGPGNYIFGIHLDTTNAIAETNEANNTAEFLISVVPLEKPDLLITQIRVVNTQTLEVSVKNNGTGSIPDSAYTDPYAQVSLQYFLDNVPSGGFGLQMVDPSRSLKTPGASVTKTIQTMLNCSASPGDHMVKFQVDYSNRLDELNEHNNIMTINLPCP